MFSDCGWKGQSAATTQKKYLKIIWLYSVFFYFLVSSGMTDVPRNYFKWSNGVCLLVWALESKSYLISSCLLSCFSLCYDTLLFFLLIQSKHSHEVFFPENLLPEPSELLYVYTHVKILWGLKKMIWSPCKPEDLGLNSWTLCKAKTTKINKQRT